MITEEELSVAISTRERSYKRLNRMQRSLLTTTSTFQPYIFCAQLALELCNMSNEAYFNYDNTTVTPTVVVDESELQYSSYRALDLGEGLLFVLFSVYITICLVVLCLLVCYMHR